MLGKPRRDEVERHHVRNDVADVGIPQLEEGMLESSDPVIEASLVALAFRSQRAITFSALQTLCSTWGCG